MRWSAPGWLAGGLAAGLLLLLLWRSSDARQRAALARFVAAHLRDELTRSISPLRRRTQRGLYLAAVMLLCVALAGPQWGYHWEQISRRGNEIVFAIDTSRSMSTPDVKPDRLARAKLAIDDFINQLNGDAVGVVAFAGSAFLVCPITLDYGALHEALSAVDTSTIPRGGTNISSAIREAQAALHRRPGSDKILILVTDGEDLEGSAVQAAEQAKAQDGLRIFTVGVGTASGDLIPIPPDQGGGFVKDEAGQFVKSHLDQKTLEAIAAATGGFYVPLGTQGEGLQSIFNRVLGPMAKHDLAARQQKVYIERYQWPLGAAFACLLASLLVSTRRRSRAAANARKAERVPAAAPARAAAAALAVLAGWGWPGTPAQAAATVPATAPASGPAAAEPEPPVAPRRDPGKPVLAYNLGTTEYRAGQFPQAAQAFTQAIVAAPSSDPKRLADQEDAYYNLGNTLYRDGQKSRQSAPQNTLKQWNAAVKAYDTALQLRPDDADSKYNRDLVKRKIEELKQDQNQNPNQQPNQDQDKKDQKSGQNPNQGQKQNQNAAQNPGQGQGQSQGQPNGPQNGGANQPKPGQPPPDANGAAGKPPQNADQPPPGQGNGQPQGAPPQGVPPKGQPQAQPPGDQDPQSGDAQLADEQPQPGQMSREEARELLDSVKGDERRAPLAPLSRRDSDDEPQQPLKNW